MLSLGKNLLSAVLLLLPGLASAVLYGDELYGEKGGGTFWVFGSNGVSIVDPDKCQVVDTIEKDCAGVPLPTRWYDGVYAERIQASFEEPDVRSLRQLDGHHHHDESRGLHTVEHYVLINSGITVSDLHGESSHGEVYAFATSPEFMDQGYCPIVAVVPVGARPVHSYFVPWRMEYWTKSDATGRFFVITLDETPDEVEAEVVVMEEVASHGKLLWDETDNLSGIGYATATQERIIFVVDMITKETIDRFNYTDNLPDPLPDERYCGGTHSIAYSRENDHVYAECVGGGGVLEFDASDPSTLAFVAQHPTVGGALYEIPDGKYVVSSDKTKSKMHVLSSGGTGSASSIDHVVDVQGHPSTPAFYDNSAGDTIACMPLTENTNLNDMYPDGTIACSHYECSPAIDQRDVDAGRCKYDFTGRSLQQVENTAQAALDGACAWCLDEQNFHPETGKCTCTPCCGTCGIDSPEICDAPNYDASAGGGVRCVNLDAVVDRGVTTSDLIADAGSVRQGGRAGYQEACAYGRTYRPQKRGGKYQATIANFPTESIQIVDMEKQDLHCAVNIAGTPQRIVYVPPQPPSPTPSPTRKEKLPAGAIAGIVIGSVIFVAGIAWSAFSTCGGGGRKGPEGVESAVESGAEIS